MTKKIKSTFSFLIIFLFCFFSFGFLFFPSPIFAICCKCESSSVAGGQEQVGTNCENVNINACEELNETGGGPGVAFSKKCTLIDCSDPLCPATETETTAIRQEIKESVPILNIKIGGTTIKFDPVKCGPGEVCPISWLAEYIDVLFKYLIGIAAILSAVVILVGGFLWLTSFGSPEKVKRAKEYIIGAMTGLLLALFSYLILFTINPNLVNFNPINLKVVKPAVPNIVAIGTGYEGETDTPSTQPAAGGTGGGSSADINDLDPAVQDRAREDLARAGRTGSTYRGNSNRHAGRHAADYPINSSLTPWVHENADRTEELAWYDNYTTTAYYVTDDAGNTTVYVDEPVTYRRDANGVLQPYDYHHWHVEYETANWQFRPSWN